MSCMSLIRINGMNDVLFGLAFSLMSPFILYCMIHFSAVRFLINLRLFKTIQLLGRIVEDKHCESMALKINISLKNSFVFDSSQ